MPFLQEPPRLGNQYDDDALLREHLSRRLPAGMLAVVQEELRHLGELGGGALYAFQQADRRNEPTLTHYDPWGRRVDRIELTPLWREAAVLAARHGLVAEAYERRYGEWSRVFQLVKAYLLDASLDVYSCPLAMTDGAARTLLDVGDAQLVERAVPRLTSRDPARMWTSGQWMTERAGGSDVGLTETLARREGGRWRLFGTKWFTSATTAEMALTLARPEGNPPGGHGLALFYLELKDAEGRPNGLVLDRLKEKLGTRKVPTAELTLEGAVAVPVAGLDGGVRHMASMLNVTRTWNAVGAVAGMRRALALARDFARRRVAFGAPLLAKPLHVETLAGLEAELEAGFLLTFRGVELLGLREAGRAPDDRQALSRLVTSLAKLTTGKQAVAVASEALECFGGAGYVEDTGLPRLLRDAQVLPIWEGTTNVLSLEAQRALADPRAGAAFAAEVRAELAEATHPSLQAPVEAASRALDRLSPWLAPPPGRAPPEASARACALSAGRTLALALLCAHAQWCLDTGLGGRAAAAARRFARHGVDRGDEPDADDARLLADG
ncbi:MAG TPA: acyl-CoA dehydrogenase family protein [Anaeromyxobacteraceae bacterium]|jgi:alkylation response protein AidB-like acyl-CoA dehydrogenase|nr:acyl-CoA dehydrogenase family protein [Anaeromyxobacteraceae bacterium]